MLHHGRTARRTAEQRLQVSSERTQPTLYVCRHAPRGRAERLGYQRHLTRAAQRRHREAGALQVHVRVERQLGKCQPLLRFARERGLELRNLRGARGTLPAHVRDLLERRLQQLVTQPQLVRQVSQQLGIERALVRHRVVGACG
eukprot:scaffold12312_cov63-Phaeocystis_antarctica.AAC.7